MFEALEPQAEDRILALMQIYADDPRTDKIDLGVGVYRDASGRTPVMRAVREAGRQLWETETTKGYTSLAGDPAFRAALMRLILGDGWPAERTAAVATPGGTGALRQALELVRMARPGATVWLPEPTWLNHLSMLRHLRMPVATYRYFDATDMGVAVAAMLDDLSALAAGDVVLLHGCCHNPTGADPGPDDWARLAALIAAKGAVPLIDLAYLGFGDGLAADAAATRRLAATCPEVLVAVSCSKTFGLYRERAGLLIATGAAGRLGTVQGNLAVLNGLSFSFPPDHGARLVTLVLNDPALRSDWVAELEAQRLRLLALREALAAELRRATGSDRFDFLTRNRGLFSRLGITPAEVERIRSERAVYIVDDGRINIAGLNPATVPVLSSAVADLVG
jgi:aromatic-amino-acid transaminase